MNVSGIFIRRPVATTILMSALVLFGWFAYRTLPVAELPSVDFPTISVSANLPGADPTTMAATVATPLERAFTQIPGVDSMTSTSSTGSTNITLQFALERDIDAAAQDVQNAISQTLRALPTSMPQPPTLRKQNPTDSPIMFIAMSATTVPLTVLDDYAETRVADRLSQLEGVAQAQVFGSKRYATRIYVNPRALTARGLSMSQLRNAVAAGNSYEPGGTLYGANRSYTVASDGQLRNAQQYNDLILAYSSGAPVRLRDVGTAVDSIANDKQQTEFNGRPAIVVAVTRQPGSNTVKIANAVRELMPDLARLGPGDTRTDLVYDRSDFINQSVEDVKLTLILSILLVIGVIFLFLRDTRATLIAALALPSSLIGTFGLMQLCGFSLDNLSLMALTLSVGFVVDDAIVVLENITRHREKGVPGEEASEIGSREIGFTVISMTLSLVAVFIPILFMGGVVGRLFREFAITVAIAILLSGVVSLTLTPMLCSRFLGEHAHLAGGRVTEWFERQFDRMRDAYARSLEWSMDRTGTMLIIAVATLVATLAMFGVVKMGFIPTQDTGVISGTTRAPEGVAYEDMVKMQRQVVDIIRKDPDVEAVISSVGQGTGGVNSSSSGRVTLRLKAPSKRSITADQVIARLRKKVAAVGGMQLLLQNPPAIRIGGGRSTSNYQYVLQGDDMQAMSAAATTMTQRMEQIPGLRDPNSDLELANPQINVNILRDRASALNVPVSNVQDTLYAAYGAEKVSTIYTASNQYDVLMQIDPQFQQDINALAALYVPTADNKLVPLGAVATVTPGVGPLSVNHAGELPAITISFDLEPGVSLGEVTGRIEQLAREVLPGTVTGFFSGTAQTFKQSTVDLPILLLFTILVIYMVLAILYEHFVHPITILTALPLATIGALISLWVFGAELNVFSFVGLILLVGLVKKNGIIMIDFAITRRREGAAARDAMIEACLVRFRPIMMTSVAAILGTLPIALGYGSGGEARQPLGIAVVGGLLTSQLLTLYVTPAFYLTMENLTGRLRRRFGMAEAPAS
ncbi:MAG TPA: efflux RND transporter permease subunit [Nevskiaceae bacterium]|nr:efflux RND transporter permease subunit [Nevskiaceae bacterium]